MDRPRPRPPQQARLYSYPNQTPRTSDDLPSFFGLGAVGGLSAPALDNHLPISRQTEQGMVRPLSQPPQQARLDSSPNETPRTSDDLLSFSGLGAVGGLSAHALDNHLTISRQREEDTEDRFSEQEEDTEENGFSQEEDTEENGFSQEEDTEENGFSQQEEDTEEYVFSKQEEDIEGLDTCKFYNTSRECDNPDCEYLHICRYYLLGNCTFGIMCKRNHDLTSVQVRAILQERNIIRSPNQLKCFFKEMFSTQTNLAATSVNDTEQESSEESDSSDYAHGIDSSQLNPCRRRRPVWDSMDKLPPPQHGSINSSPNERPKISDDLPSFFGLRAVGGLSADAQNNYLIGISRQMVHKDTEGLDTCKFYNTSRECDNPDCEYLHICRHYLLGDCSFGRQCKRNHDLNSKQVRDILQERNIRGSPKQLKYFFRKLFSTQTSVYSDDVDSSNDWDECEESCGICPFHLNRKCRFGSKCRDHHKDLPYQWQCTSTDFENNWLDVDPRQNSILEDYYCDVNKSVCTISTIGGECLVYFEMETDGVFGSSSQNYHFRRLSTSPVSENNRLPNGTEWKWYWENDLNRWEEYGNSNEIISNNHLEAAYLDSKDMRFRIKSQARGYEYLFDFNRNLQVNMNTGKGRQMRHRPVFVSIEEFEEKRLTGGVTKRTSTHDMKIPSNWTISGSANVHDHYRRVEIFDQTSGKQLSEDSLNIIASFQQSMPPSAIIHAIERVENGELWVKYTSEKENINRKNKSPNEMDLFHGTASENTEAICRQGFDFRMNGTSTGTKYGKGSYFAKDAKLSDRYVSQTSVSRIMFRAKVAVGEYTGGQSSYSRPPAKSHHELYNSCVNDMANPKIFVIFSLHQAYPEYIIHYTLNHKKI